MAAQQPINDDAISLDDDDLQATATTQPPPAPVLFTSGAAPTTITTTSSAALEQWNNEQRKKALEDYDNSRKHPSTTAFEGLIACPVLELADFWFCQGSPYDHVCLAKANWRDFGSVWRLGDFYTRAEFHGKLYAYTLRRICAVGILLEKGYELLDDGLSASDDAFALVVQAMVVNYQAMMPSIVDWTARGRKRTVMIDHPRLLKAIRIVIGNNSGRGRTVGRDVVPMKFRVQTSLSMGEIPRSAGRTAKVEEVAFFWFNDVGDGGKWETEMEIVAMGDEALICDGRAYEI